jgi:hypothetical protein
MSDATPSPASEGADWPAQAADTIVRLVDQVRSKTAGPAITAARGIVYGLLAGLLGAMAGVLAAIIAVRLLDEATQGIFGTRETWLAYLAIGAAFSGAGWVLWSKRRPPAEAD